MAFVVLHTLFVCTVNRVESSSFKDVIRNLDSGCQLLPDDPLCVPPHPEEIPDVEDAPVSSQKNSDAYGAAANNEVVEPEPLMEPNRDLYRRFGLRHQFQPDEKQIKFSLLGC